MNFKKTKKKTIEEIEEAKEEPMTNHNFPRYVAIRDISLEIRKGNEVPLVIVENWKNMGIKTELMVKLI